MILPFLTDWRTQTINRTKVELKYEITTACIYLICSINRTKVELKS